MGFLDKIKGWFGGKKEETAEKGGFGKAVDELAKKTSSAEGATYEERIDKAREAMQITNEGREAIKQAITYSEQSPAEKERTEVAKILAGTPAPAGLEPRVEAEESILKPKPAPEFKITRKKLEGYLNAPEKPLEKYILSATKAEQIDKNYLMRIKHELLGRPELLTNKVNGRFYCPPLEDYLRAMNYSYVPQEGSEYSEIDYIVERILGNILHDLEWAEEERKVSELQKEVVNEYMEREDDPFGAIMKDVLGVSELDRDRIRVVRHTIKNNPVMIEEEICFELEDYIRAMGKSNEEAIAQSKEILRKVYSDITTEEKVPAEKAA